MCVQVSHLKRWEGSVFFIHMRISVFALLGAESGESALDKLTPLITNALLINIYIRVLIGSRYPYFAIKSYNVIFFKSYHVIFFTFCLTEQRVDLWWKLHFSHVFKWEHMIFFVFIITNPVDDVHFQKLALDINRMFLRTFFRKFWIYPTAHGMVLGWLCTRQW